MEDCSVEQLLSESMSPRRAMRSRSPKADAEARSDISVKWRQRWTTCAGSFDGLRRSTIGLSSATRPARLAMACTE